MILCEPKSMLEAWFRTRTGVEHRLEDCSYIAKIDLDHKIVSVLVFHEWRGRDIQIDIAPGFIPRALLRAARRYVDQLNVDRVTFKFRDDNHRSRRAAVRLGAELEGRIRRFYSDGADQVIYGILKEDYRLG